MGVIDLGYRPRVPQVALHQALESHRWVVGVCHRRMGKTVAAVAHMTVKATECQKPRPRFAYIGPTLKQARQIAWDYLKALTKSIPQVEQRESELAVNLWNGARVQLFGADNPDALRGLYFDGVVFDEYGLQPGNIFSEVVRPGLSDRQGWALFLGTPNGKNQFYDMAQRAQTDDTGTWAYLCFKASETGIIVSEELADARTMMTEDEYAQEYECSWEAAVKGSIYGKEMDAAQQEGRIGVVPVDPVLPVETTWDLGVGDATAIWFVQRVRGGEVRLVDYYEAQGEGLPHFAQVLQQKGYTYGKHYAPHDIQVRELGSGRSRWEVAKSLGITFEVIPRMHGGIQQDLEEGIHAVRMLLGKCWFDAQRCHAGIEALRHYRRDYNRRLQEYKAVPIHDWSSHAADAFRYLSVWVTDPTPKVPKEPRMPLYTSPSGWLAG